MSQLVLEQQCAWCRHLIIDGKRIGDPLASLVEMSHGICLVCAESLEEMFKASEEAREAN